MNAEGKLLRACREWRRLAEAETRAIQTRNWSLLTDCHLAIQDFQNQIGGLSREARAEWRRAGCPVAEKEHNLQALISGLIELTRRNQGLLASTATAARKQLDQLGEAGKNLKRLRRSYGLAPAWNQAG